MKTLAALLLFTTAMQVGCSLRRVIFAHADFIALREVDQWLDLNKDQKKAFEPLIKEELVLIKKQYLPKVFDVLKTVSDQAQVKIEAGHVKLVTEAFSKFQASQEGLSQALSRLMVVVEKYPDLKANENFRDLQSQLEGTENRIAVARGRYIATVAEYNKSVRSFPTNLTAKYLLHLSTRESFTASAQAKDAPKVEF